MDIRSDDNENTFEENFLTEIYVWGENKRQQCGVIEEQILKPTKVLLSIPIRQISCGQAHTALMTNEGQIYTMGDNQFGQLGIGQKSIEMSNEPQLVPKLQYFSCINVASGKFHSIVITEEGDCFSWGEGGNYCLGNKKTENIFEPISIDFENAQNVFCGQSYSLILDKDQQLHICGIDIINITKSSFIQEFTKINFNQKITDVACGSTYFVFLDDINTLFLLGVLSEAKQLRNAAVRLSLQDPNDQILQICGGYQISIVTEMGLFFLNENNGLIEKIDIDGKIMECAFSKHFGYCVDEERFVWEVNLTKQKIIRKIEELKEIRSINCGHQFVITLGPIVSQKTKKQDGYSPIIDQLRNSQNSSLVQTQNQDLYSFSIKKELSSLSLIKKSEGNKRFQNSSDRRLSVDDKETQTDQNTEGIQIQLLQQEIQNLKNERTYYLQYQDTQQNQIQRLTIENSKLLEKIRNLCHQEVKDIDKKKEKKIHLEKIQKKKEEIQLMIDNFYVEHKKIMQKLQKQKQLEM